MPIPHHLTIPHINAFPLPATRSLTISPSRRATSRERYVLNIRNVLWLISRPVSLLFHLGIMILSKLRNWCKNARFNPGFVVGGGICEAPDGPPPRPAARGGFRNSRLCASNVVGFVGYKVTLDVDDLYGTYIIRDPSFLRMPEFFLNSRLPCARSLVLSCHHLYPP